MRKREHHKDCFAQTNCTNINIDRYVFAHTCESITIIHVILPDQLSESTFTTSTGATQSSDPGKITSHILKSNDIPTS